MILYLALMSVGPGIALGSKYGLKDETGLQRRQKKKKSAEMRRVKTYL